MSAHCSGKTPRGHPLKAIYIYGILAKATTAFSPGLILWHITQLRASKRTCLKWGEGTEWDVRGVRYHTNRGYGTNSSILPHTFLLPMAVTLNLMVSLSVLYMTGFHHENEPWFKSSGTTKCRISSYGKPVQRLYYYWVLKNSAWAAQLGEIRKHEDCGFEIQSIRLCVV